MIDCKSLFAGKKITLMGLGLLGRGMGDARFLAACGAELTVTDLKSADELKPSLDALRAFQNINFVLGEHRVEDFQSCDLVVKAAGVPLDSPYVAEAKKRGIPVRMSADLFAEHAGIPIVGITGTRGKSTVAHMIVAVLRAAGKKVILGGNVRGVSTLALLSEIEPDTVAVLELDSWQLQGFGDAKMSPNLAVFTTFYPDHMNYYHGDMDVYLADKANIFLYQKSDDVLVLGDQCADLVEQKYAGKIRSRTLRARAADLPLSWTLSVPGEHNRGNAVGALMAARALGIADDTTRRALEGFAGVEGRLQQVRQWQGIAIYNDTTSTTPEATVAALAALDPKSARRVILIMGGADKGLDMSRMRDAVHAHAKQVIFLSGTGTKRIRGDAPDVPIFDSLQGAVEAAIQAAAPGDSILFSPAFASFGMFTNEYDRGEQFMRIVQSLT